MLYYIFHALLHLINHYIGYILTLEFHKMFVWGRILFLATRKLVCPLWGAKPAWFCSQGRVWENSRCSPTSAREAPHSCLISAWHKHECTPQKPAQFCSQATWEEFECSPTSGREALHSCLISAWHKHKCTTTTKQNHAGLAPQSEQTSFRVAKNKILPRISHP